MGRITCPHCSAAIDASVTVCPNCRIAIIRKSRALLYLIIGCVVFVAIVVALLLFYLPAPRHTPAPPLQPPVIPAAAGVPAAIPAMVEAPGPGPSCTIAITGSRIPPATIQLRVMSSTCFDGDIIRLRVLINGEEEGTLAPGPGSSWTFTGTAGPDNVVVAAAFSNGAGSVVYQNAAL